MSKTIEINLENYKNFLRIGNGTYGTVYRAIDKRNGLYVSIKEIIKEKFDKAKELLQREIEIMKKIKCENSVNIIDVIEKNEYYYIIMEYCEYNLEDYINKKREKPFSINEIKEMLIQLNNIFKIILEENIILKDLKPSNILIYLDKLDKIIFKLSHYGSSKIMNDKTIIYIDSPLTMAPEILNDKIDLICSKSDIWSLGILIYYMLFKEYPFNGKGEYQILKEIESNKKLKQSENEKLNDLLFKMLKVNVNERISWEDYFNHPFFEQEISNDYPIFDFSCKLHNQNIIYYCKDFNLINFFII